MKNYIRESCMITLTAPAGGLASGAGVIIGNLFGIASHTVLVGELEHHPARWIPASGKR